MASATKGSSRFFGQLMREPSLNWQIGFCSAHHVVRAKCHDHLSRTRNPVLEAPPCTGGRNSVRSPPRCALPVPPPSLSAPFPLGDLFLVPTPVFMNVTQMADDARPEVVGAVLWSIGLYFGFSQKVRWGEALRLAIAHALPFSAEIADNAATALHTLPFLFAGLGIDASLKYWTGGNSTWGVAIGLGIAMYGVVYELARSSARSKVLDETESQPFSLFTEFATRRLEQNGRCHLQDIRAALREDDRARRLGRMSDEQLRRFIRTWAPGAIRSRNGFYRNLSVRINDQRRSIF